MPRLLVKVRALLAFDSGRMSIKQTPVRVTAKKAGVCSRHPFVVRSRSPSGCESTSTRSAAIGTSVGLATGLNA
ncbi:hypothetical protein [Streptomyces sp. NPDC058280]|uniref:hypothetical protein n=1 Tax=Streptomyces sp. NPDC058280 TaxID=3346419 RepID=UPI0036E72FCC